MDEAGNGPGNVRCLLNPGECMCDDAERVCSDCLEALKSCRNTGSAGC